MAIMLAEELGERRGSVDVKIYGTASVVHSVDQPLVVLDQAFRVTSWNPGAERLWGLAERLSRRMIPSIDNRAAALPALAEGQTVETEAGSRSAP